MAVADMPNRGAVFISGSSTGIGKGTALCLDKLGFRVFAGVRRQKDGEALRCESSESLTPVIVDLNEKETIDKALETISEAVGEDGLSGLVNNAGIPLEGPLEFFPIDEIRKGLEVNLIGHITVIQRFLPLIRKRKGRIINVGSIGGILPIPFGAPYNASKAAMHALTITLRRELLPSGIHVSLVVPGTIRTEIWKKIQEQTGHLSSDVIEWYGHEMDALRRAAEKIGGKGIPPESVGKVVAKALTKKKPKTCYIVGSDARLQRLVAMFLPGRIQDRVVLRMIGI